ncbi:MAG: GTPase, partial [Acidiferrobacter sp.]
MAPMESQVREHQAQLRRRLESIKRIHQASDTLEARMAELKQVLEEIGEQHRAAHTTFTRIRAMLNQAP